jgi:outer membrane receptor protein involved in Fe transport
MQPFSASSTRLRGVSPTVGLTICLAFGLLGLRSSSVGQDAISATASARQDLTRLSLEELMDIQVPSVTSASKFEQKITEAPAAVTVITSYDVTK